MADEIIPLGQVRVDLKCGKCGSTEIVLPDDPTDDSIAYCEACGTQFGRWGDLQKKIAAAAVNDAVVPELRKAIKRRFKGSKSVKVKD